MSLSRQKFLQTLPDVMIPMLPKELRTIKVKQPWKWMMQFHYGEPRLHYEVSRVHNGQFYELGLHFEERDKQLNKFLLQGMRRHLIEIKHTLGDHVEAEPWDRGWAKIYDLTLDAEGEISEAYQEDVALKLARFITHIQPIYRDVRRDVSRIYK